MIDLYSFFWTKLIVTGTMIWVIGGKSVGTCAFVRRKSNFRKSSCSCGTEHQVFVEELQKIEQLSRIILQRFTYLRSDFSSDMHEYQHIGEQDLERSFERVERLIKNIFIIFEPLTFIRDQSRLGDAMKDFMKIVILGSFIRNHYDVTS